MNKISRKRPPAGFPRSNFILIKPEWYGGGALASTKDREPLNPLKIKRKDERKIMGLRCAHGFLYKQCGLCGDNMAKYTAESRHFDYESGKVLPHILKTTNNNAKSGILNKKQGVKCDKTPGKLVRNIRKIPKKEEKIMENTGKKTCCIPGCDCTGGSRGLSRDMCSKHWYQWRHGKILHPILGEWEPSEHYIHRTKIKKEKRENMINKNENQNKDEDVKRALFSKLTDGLKQIEALGTTLCIFGCKDQVKKEIELSVSNFSFLK